MPNFFGKSGKSAFKTFKNIINKASRKMELPHINRTEKQQIFTRVEKVFTKRGKEPVKMDIAKMQKEVFNPLRYKHNDSLDRNEVSEVEKVLGFNKVYTKKIGSKYSEITRAEKRLEAKNRIQKVAELEKMKKPSRLEAIQQEIKGKEPKVSLKISNNKTSSETSQAQSGVPIKKTSNSDSGAEVKEVKGFKTQPQLRSGGKSRSWTSAPASSISYNFSGIGSKFKSPQESDSNKSEESAAERLYKALRPKMPKEISEQKSELEKHDFWMDAYEGKTANSSVSQNAPDSEGTKNKDIDD